MEKELMVLFPQNFAGKLMKTEMDTVRLILFLDCNLSCSYCCNEQSQFSSQFQEKYLNEIDWDKYKNICISGGEPFLRKDALYKTINHLFGMRKDLYIYTNGLLIDLFDMEHLKELNPIDFECGPYLKCLNIGIHHPSQLKAIHPELEKKLPVRWMCQDLYVDDLMKLYPDRVNKYNLKGWKLNDCNMSNEDWILLKDWRK
jgi:hypothetical protein